MNQEFGVFINPERPSYAGKLVMCLKIVLRMSTIMMHPNSAYVLKFFS